MLRTKGSIPYLLFVFASSFLQMGLFLFIEQWLKFSYRGDDFLIDSAFLQAMFFLPYILLFPFAGYLANKFDKVKVIAWTSVGAFFITAAFAFLWGLSLCDAAIWLVIPLSSLFALNSPAKYGLLKEMYGKSRLVHSNAYLQSAIVLAAILSTIVMMGFYGEREMSFQMCYLPWSFAAISFFAAVAAFCIPVSGFSSPSMKMRSPARIFRSTWNTTLFRLCIVGLSLFWGIAQVFVLLSQDFSGESMLTLMQKGLFFSGLGMILGAYVASRFSHSFIETGFIPISVLGGSVGMLFITFFSSPLVLSILYAWLGFCFGAFGVIMNALLQENTKPDTSGRILAVANMVEMTLLIAFIGVQAVLLNFTNIDKETFFFILAIFLLASFVWAFIKLPQSLLRTVLRMFFAFRYRLKIKGNNNIPAEGPVLLMGNHSSYIDWAILQMTSPRSIRMASNADRYENNFLKWILTLLGVIRINRRDPAPAMWAIRKALLAGEAVVIFPEGELSKSSNISRFSIDYSEAIQGTNAKIIPFYIQGLWGGRYSYANESVCFGESLTRIVTIAFGKDVPATTSPQVLRNTLRELSMEAWNTSISFYPTLAPLWLKATKKLVGSKISIYSPLGNHISGFKLIQNVLIHSKKVRVIAHKEQNVGFMFPPSPEGVSTLLSIWVAGKTSVNLNYTSGIETVIKCIERADVKTVFTSWAFLDKLQKRGQNYFQLGSVCKLICVEDVDKLIYPISRVAAWLASVAFPAGLIEFCYFKRVKRDDTAVVLFSSGSEGTPKGVMLSHKNLVANVQQANAIFTIRPYDVMLAELPIFHSFGLTATILMSLVEGIPMVTCAEPTDVKTMARVCAEFKATILIGTPTFLRAVGVNRWVHPMCFKHLRLVLSGAEKLRPEIRDLFARKFKKEIYEGYGCTETAPVATFNSEDVLLDDFITMDPCSNLNSVGVPIPGTCVKIADPITDVELPQGEEGMILIGGCQVMKGYLKDPERTASVIIERKGQRWYKTGDKGKVDEDGFVIIVDRYSRFAKLGGEMISLGAVEAKINDSGILAGMEFLAVAVPDEAKGEKIVLLYHGDKDADQIQRELRKSGIPQMMQPGKVFSVDAVPKLGSGKWDFTTAKKIAKELCEASK